MKRKKIISFHEKKRALKYTFSLSDPYLKRDDNIEYSILEMIFLYYEPNIGKL
jgi:hypothetical protein